MGALCSPRLVTPLARLLDERRAEPCLIPDALRSAAPGERVPVELLHGTFERAAEHFRDPALGLTLGHMVSLGEMGPFDYLLRTAPSARAALEAAGRYSALQGDRYQILYEAYRGGALIHQRDESSWPRTIADMSMSASFKLHVGRRARFTSRLECWFPYTAPADLATHLRCFPGAVLRFGAPFYAFYVDAGYERAPQPGADPTVHALLRERFDAVLRDMIHASTLALRVRRAIERLLREARPADADVVARSLCMSRRTLSRRLLLEGTSFTDEFEAVRQQLAFEYVRDSQRPFAEVAFLLGYAHAESFHRAFKRWTGTTPLAHRAAAVS